MNLRQMLTLLEDETKSINDLTKVVTPEDVSIIDEFLTSLDYDNTYQKIEPNADMRVINFNFGSDNRKASIMFDFENEHKDASSVNSYDMFKSYTQEVLDDELKFDATINVTNGKFETKSLIPYDLIDHLTR